MIRHSLATIVFMGLFAPLLLAQTDPAIAVAIPEAWDTFSADVTLRHQRLAAGSDAPRLSAPDSTFHFERTRASGSWKTVITVLSSGLPGGAPGSGAIQARSAQAHVGMRLEDAGDGSPLSLVDPSGKALPLPQMKELRRRLGNPPLLHEGPPFTADAMPTALPQVRTTAASDWVEGFVIPAAGREARVRALKLRHRPQRERVRGLDRYVTSEVGRESEVLVDPSSALPVETNVVENGMLISHATYDYAPYGADALVRTRVQVERLLPDGTGERSITVINTNNIRFEQRGGQR